MLGEVRVMLLKMLIKTRNKVTKSVILPGTISGGIRKLDQRDNDKESGWQVVIEQIFHIMPGSTVCQNCNFSSKIALPQNALVN